MPPGVAPGNPPPPLFPHPAGDNVLPACLWWLQGLPRVRRRGCRRTERVWGPRGCSTVCRAQDWADMTKIHTAQVDRWSEKKGSLFNRMGHSYHWVHRRREWGRVQQPSVGRRQTTCMPVSWGDGWPQYTGAHVYPRSAVQRVPSGWHRLCPLLRCERGPPQERDSPCRQDNWVQGRLHVGQQGCRRDHTAPELEAVRTDRATSLAEKRALPHHVLQTGTVTQGKTSPLPAPALP